MFGDRLGGLLLFVYLAVYGAVKYVPNVLTAVTKNKLGDLQALLPQVYSINKIAYPFRQFDRFLTCFHA